MKMKMMAAFVGLACLIATGAALPAAAATIDFTGAGTIDYQAVAQSYGDSAEADLSYRSLTGGNNWGQTATQSADHVDYWSQANYSHDQAIFAAASTNKLELSAQAGAGLNFTSVTFDLGSYPNNTQVIAFKLYDSGWNEILSNDTFSIDGTTGSLITLALNTSAFYFQMGDNWNTGVRALTFQTAAATPVPPALLLFLTGLGGLGFAGWRRKQATLA
jgi:hypothetical protein